MRLNFSPQLLLLIVVFAVTSCTSSKKKQSISINQFQEYVSGVTTGAIKRNESVIIKFTHDIIAEDQRGSEVPKSVFNISPDVDGKAMWVNPDAIEFKPSKLFEWNTEYSGTLNLDRLVQVPDELKKLVFTFQTSPKQMLVHNSGISISANGDDSYQLKGEVETSDEFVPDELEKIFFAFQGKKKLNINWEHHPKSFRHLFTVSGIARKDVDTEVVLQWDGGKIGIDGDEEKQIVKVPPLNDFKASSARVVNTPDQYVEILFSDPVNSEKDLRGLVSIDNQSISKFRVEYNALRIYPDRRLNGMHTVTLNAALESTLGYKLGEKTSYTLNFGGLKPEVKLLGNGVIVPQSEGLFFPF
ncbi:MAG: hypothetical protein JW798_17710, partial [Prolixibacteraceae bacterium]|nr:hypothetical protein [Prolixibacteraceae bacterium]